MLKQLNLLRKRVALQVTKESIYACIYVICALLRKVKHLRSLKLLIVNTHNCLKLQISVSATYSRNDSSSLLALAVIRWLLNAWKVNKQTKKQQKQKLKKKQYSNRSPCDIFRYSRIVLAVAKLDFRKTVLPNEHSYLVFNQDRKLDRKICTTEMNV